MNPQTEPRESTDLASPPESRTRRATRTTFRTLAIALGFAIPVSVALDNILLGLLVLLWPFAVDRRQWLADVRTSPFAWALVAFALVHVIGATYARVPAQEITASLYAALRIGLFVVLVTAFHDARSRAAAGTVALATMGITLLLSYLLCFGWIPKLAWFKANEMEPLVFKQHITHNFFMAYAAFACLVLADAGRTPLARIGWASLAGAMAINVLVMIRGKTGHLVLLMLLLYWFLARFRWRGAIVGLGLAAAVASGVWLHGHNALYTRVVEMIEQLQTWKPGERFEGSVSQRLEFYNNTLHIIRDHPVTGVGTGGFRAEYAKQVAGTDMTATHNPHNEYLKVTAELGIAGLAALIAIFWTGWYCAGRLDNVRDVLLTRGLMLSYGLASMVTSTLMDHAEGLFFVWMSAVLLAASRRNPDTVRP